MPTSFRNRIRSALTNQNLQAALDDNAERRRNARLLAYQSLLEDVQALRQRAHAVRAETIANLDRYLEKFIARVQANGLVVHHATSAAQAVQIVLEIARQNGAKVIAKSKTMVGEEIELNRALEAAGLQVVETDLGEYIVQLRGERPSHITTPAVHLRRADVGRTFQEKLGLPFTDDVSTLTAAARRELRGTFLQADIGISGVNFGVVETGSLCLLTNEGNGRMVSTLPPVHIALMGIERLAPTLGDLALLLSLLPRTSTGQKMTVYTSLIHSPRRPEDADGPRQRHLVLVDNGRRAIRGSHLAEILFCIRCGACLNACPVFREIGGHAYVSVTGEGSVYGGPLGAVLSPALFGQSEFGHLARASSLCGACKEACPVDIDLPTLLLRVRAGGIAPLVPQSGSAMTASSGTSSVSESVAGNIKPNPPAALGLGLRLFAWLASDARRFAAAQTLAGVVSRILSPFSNWMRLPALTGWGYQRDFPRPAVRPFRSRWRTSLSYDRDLPPLSGAGKDELTHPLLSPDGVEKGDGEIIEVPPDRPTSGSSLLSRFANELALLGGEFVQCKAGELNGRVLAFLRERGISSILAWEEADLPPGLLLTLRMADIQVMHRFDAAAELAGAPAVRAGLTGALAGIAESGTLVLPSGAGRPQAASLMAEIHIAVLNSTDIYADLPQALQSASLREIQEISSVALISGPSRTADIEMTLTIGMHGPKAVHVVCVS